MSNLSNHINHNLSNSLNCLNNYLIVIILLVLPQPLLADWINLTGAETSPNIAEIIIHNDHIKLKLEIYINDLKHYKALIPADLYKDSKKIEPLEQRMERFSKDKFAFVTELGEYLPAQLKLVEPRQRKDRFSPFAGMVNPITRQQVPKAPEDKRVLYAEIIYPFMRKPKSLTIIPPSDDKGVPLSTIGFIAYHKSVPIIDFRYLNKTVLHLNWDDPWYTKFENPNLKRHHKDAMMSYLYIEDFEVRHEVLIRVKDLKEWLDLRLSNPDYIEVDESESVKQNIAEFLATKNPVTIDGQQIQPIIDRSNYVKVSMQGIQILEKPQRLDTNTAIVGVILTYLVDKLPQKVTVDWELFNERIQTVPASATDPAGPLSSYLTPEFPKHEWTNFLKKYQPPQVVTIQVDKAAVYIDVPVLSVVLVLLAMIVFWAFMKRQRLGFKVRYHWLILFILGVAVVLARPYGNISMKRPVELINDLTPEQANVLIQSLLKNVYRAFDFRDEEAIYDKLAVSIEGNLLTDIYLQNRQSFAVQQAGGAQAKVNEVTIQSVQPTRKDSDQLSYTMHTQWRARGSVGHWGHTHIRENHYDAIITISAIDGQWKIIQLDLIEEKRIDSGTNKK